VTVDFGRDAGVLMAKDALHRRGIGPGHHEYSTLPTGGQATITVTVAAPSGAMVTATYAATVRPAVTATVTELTVPTAGASPQSIALGGDNGMWFTEFLGHKVGRVATTVGQAGTIAEYAVSGAAYGIASGMGAVEANTLWFTEAGTGVGSGTAIGSMGLDGTIFNETSTPTYDEPWAIAADSSGNMWFTEAEGSAIGEITGLNIKEFPLPMQNTGTYGITIVNSVIWFTEESGALGSLVPSTMTITEFTGLSANGGITLGPDNNIWFLETKKIGSIDPATKTIKELPIWGQPNGAASGLVIGTQPSGTEGIAVGADGTIWFTENAANKIGRISR
jgi:virginiamycin B lyase